MGSGDWTCAMPEHWLFTGTGMKKGDSIKGLLGWEWHGAPAMDLPGMSIVARGDATINGKTVGQYSSTLYDGPKDNIVFNAATIWWANGLSSPPGHGTSPLVGDDFPQDRCICRPTALCTRHQVRSPR